jgi:hypothetical protein
MGGGGEEDRAAVSTDTVTLTTSASWTDGRKVALTSTLVGTGERGEAGANMF